MNKFLGKDGRTGDLGVRTMLNKQSVCYSVNIVF
jgi:hypothetical protein